MPVVPDEKAAQLAPGCVGRLGMESFLAPQTITHAAHVKVDRETGVVRVLRFAAAHDSGRILNRIGADGQVYGGVVMGIGQALSEGSMHDEDGRQRNPHLLDYKLVTSADAPQIDVSWVEIDTPNAGPKGSKGVGEPPCVPDRRRGRQRDRAGPRPPRRPPADDARARLGRGARERRMSGTFVAADSLEEALDALAAGARPVAGGTDLVVGSRSGGAAAARRDRRDPRARRPARADRRRRRPARAARSSRTRRSPPTRTSPSATRRSPTPRRSSGRTRPAPRGRSAAT